MKKYILNLLKTDVRPYPGSHELAFLIARYNQEQPKNEFINWLINNLSGEYFIFYPFGNSSAVGPHSYNIVNKRNNVIEVGTIQVVEI